MPTPIARLKSALRTRFARWAVSGPPFLFLLLFFLAPSLIMVLASFRYPGELTNLIGSGNPNAAAMPFVMPELAANPAVFPNAEHLKKLDMLHDLDRHQRRVLNRIWTEINIR